MAKRGVIFDMDGVLVDSYRAHFESWRRLAAKHGLQMSEQQFASTFGKTSREIIRQFWANVVDEADIPRWDEEKEALYREELLANFPEMDGASDLLRQLDTAGFALAVGSSGPPENVEVVLKCLTAGKLIHATVNGHEVTHGKPNPDVFLRAAEKLRIEPIRCAIVEDAPVGIEAAHRAGMAAVAITGTATRQQLAAAEIVVDSLREFTPETFADLIDRKSRGGLR